MPPFQSLGSSGDSRLCVSPLQKGHREEKWEAGAFLEGKSNHSHPPPAYFKPQAEIQGRESHVGLPGGNLTA